MPMDKNWDVSLPWGMASGGMAMRKLGEFLIYFGNYLTDNHCQTRILASRSNISFGGDPAVNL